MCCRGDNFAFDGGAASSANEFLDFCLFAMCVFSAPAASLQPILVQGKQEVAEPPKPAPATTVATTTPAPTATTTSTPAPALAEAAAPPAAPASAPAPAPAQEAQVIDEFKMIQSLQASDTDRYVACSLCWQNFIAWNLTRTVCTFDSHRNRQGHRVWTSGEKRPTETSQSHHPRKPMLSTVPPPNYVCHRCGRPGHYIQHCPTNNDPRFNKPPAQKPQQRMLGVPTTAVTKVQDLTEVDTHGKLVFQTSDGYNVVQPSQHNFEHLIKLGYVLTCCVDATFLASSNFMCICFGITQGRSVVDPQRHSRRPQVRV